jgi:hypothetical protein
MIRIMKIAVTLAVISLATLLAVAQGPATLAQTTTGAVQAPGDNQSVQTAEGVVRALYSLVSVKPGGARTDWDRVRALFYKDAVILLRNTPQTTTVFSVQGFIDDFVAFDERARVQERGFSEKILRLKPMAFRDIAHVLVLYEASIPASPRPPQQGVDSFQLMKKDGRWWIISIANELPAPGSPIPKELEQ